MDELVVEEPTSTMPAPSKGGGGRSMKLISCVIRPESLEAVKEALNTLQVVGGMTITEVRGFGRQKGQVEHYRGGEYTIRMLPKVRLELAVRDEDVDQVLNTVSRAARTGQVGDGKAFIFELRNVIRLRTGERGVGAL